jgi:hypothetical protein
MAIAIESTARTAEKSSFAVKHTVQSTFADPCQIFEPSRRTKSQSMTIVQVASARAAEELCTTPS